MVSFRSLNVSDSNKCNQVLLTYKNKAIDTSKVGKHFLNSATDTQS